MISKTALALYAALSFTTSQCSTSVGNPVPRPHPNAVAGTTLSTLTVAVHGVHR